VECCSHDKYKGKLIRLQEFLHLVFLFHFGATVLYTRHLFIYSFMLLQALHVEIGTNKLNLQAGFILKKNVRYPIWVFRDPIFSDSRDPVIIFSDSRDPIFNSRDPNRVLILLLTYLLSTRSPILPK